MPKYKKRFQQSEDIKATVCRVCLNVNTDSPDDVMLSLFEPHQELSISSQLSALADVKVNAGDGLPDRICRGCLAELRAALLFRQKCRHSDRQLRGLPSEPAEVKKEEPDEYQYECLESTWEQEDGFSQNNEDFVLVSHLDVKKEVDSKVDIYIPAEKHVQCHDCGETFKSKCKLRVHWMKNHKIKSYICDICRREFKNLKSYIRHKKIKTKTCELVAIEGVRVEGEGRSRVFHCSFCDYETRKINSMKAHTVIHSGKRPYTCNLCPKAFTQAGSLIKHKAYRHNMNTVEIPCNFCGKLIKGRDKVYQHLSTHSTERYQCDICKKLYKNKKILATHLERHSGVKRHMCDLCGAAYYCRTDLLTHTSTKHREQKYFQCKYCTFKAKTKKVIETHQKKHNDNNFACPILRCGLFFDNELSFRLHERKHIDGKIHDCSLCGERFKRKVYLVTHLKRKHKTEDTNAMNVAIVKVKPEDLSL